MDRCAQCGIVVGQEPHEQGGLLVTMTDVTGREAYRYWVPPDNRMEFTVVRTHPCGTMTCERALRVRDGVASIE